jgi:hypothetical protein
VCAERVLTKRDRVGLQITFDFLDTVTGLVQRGRIVSATRVVLRDWLAQFAGRGDVTFAVECCTGWRIVVEELQAAGITALLAEPTEAAHQRGPKKRAKTDKADARRLRELVTEGRVPLSWIPTEQACGRCCSSTAIWPRNRWRRRSGFTPRCSTTVSRDWPSGWPTRAPGHVPRKRRHRAAGGRRPIRRGRTRPDR